MRDPARSAAPPRVSIVVPVHDGGAAFERCLRSLRAVSPPPLEVIVVCDGCRDGSAAAARDADCRVLAIAGPRGPAVARNLGAHAARGELLLFLDADVEVPPSLVGRVAARFEADASLDAVIGSYDDSPSDPGFLSQYRNLLHHFVHQTASPDASTFWGACGAIRRDVFAAAGGFDESYAAPSIEDIELGGRLKRAGRRIALDSALQVKHLKRWRPWTLVKTDVLRRALPWTRLILRQRRLPDDLNLRRAARCTTVCLILALVAAAASALRREAILLVAALLAAAVALNSDFYRFLAKKRGAAFALRAVPWHWLYFLYSGAAFAVGVAQHLMAGGRTGAADVPLTGGKPGV
jgi:GT2 family glycosyltransferase